MFLKERKNSLISPMISSILHFWSILNHELRNIAIIVAVFSCTLLYSQDQYKYHCTRLGNSNFEIKTTAGSDILPYQGSKLNITKLEILNNGEDLGQYFIYEFKERIYILNGDATVLNYSKDQSFFDRNIMNYIYLKLNGVLADVTLNYLGNLAINDTEFFNYSVTNKVKGKVFLTNIRFDNKMRVDEWRFKSVAGDKCECVKENIRIKLK